MKARIDVAFQGARLHYAVPRVFARAGLLRTFYTDAYFGNKPRLQAVLGYLPAAFVPSALDRFMARKAPDLPVSKVVSFDKFGLKTAWMNMRRCSWLELEKRNARLAREFCELVVGAGLSGATALYGLNNQCLEVFQAAKREGIPCIMEQCSAPRPVMAQLLNTEVACWPGWEPQLSRDAGDGPLAQREEAEWRLADRIVCGSEFVAESLRSLGVDSSKCVVVPYGIDTRDFRPFRRERRPGLNVLFVGYVSLRKGVPYLLEAVRQLDSPSLRCRLVGTVQVDSGRLTQYARWVEVVGPVPRSQILSFYQWADILVLPAVCEGSAMVTYEAVACGLPVITTPNAGSVVRDGSEGFIVPARDSEGFAQALTRFLIEPQLLGAMSENALKRSRQFDLAHYGERLLRAIQLPS